MDPLSIAQVAGALSLPIIAAEALSRNPSFPAPVSWDNAGNPHWDPTAVATFGGLLSAALSAGWKFDLSNYPSADFAVLATSAPGPDYSTWTTCEPCDVVE